MAEKFGFKYDPKKISSGSVLNGVDIGYGKSQHAPIKNVEDIYKLDYIYSELKKRTEGKNPPFRLLIKMQDMATRLEKLLDEENRRLGFAIYLWKNFDCVGHAARKADRVIEKAGGVDKLKEKLSELDAFAFNPNPLIDPTVFAGMKMPNGAQLTAKMISSLEKRGRGNTVAMLRRLYPEAIAQAADKQTKKLLNAPDRPMLDKFQLAIDKIEEAKTLSEKLIAFHTALSTAHKNGSIARNVYGWDNGVLEKLDHLSNMDIPQEWENEINKHLKTR